MDSSTKSPDKIQQQSSTQIASSSSVRNHTTPEPMDTVDSSASMSNSSEPISSHTSEQMGIAASSTLVLVNSSEEGLAEPLQVVPTGSVETASSSEQVQTSSSEVSSSFGVQVGAASSSEYEDILLNTGSASDSVSASNSADSFVADPGPPIIKLSGSTLFKSIGPNCKLLSFLIVDNLSLESDMKVILYHLLYLGTSYQHAEFEPNPFDFSKLMYHECLCTIVNFVQIQLILELYNNLSLEGGMKVIFVPFSLPWPVLSRHKFSDKSIDLLKMAHCDVLVNHVHV